MVHFWFLQYNINLTLSTLSLCSDTETKGASFQGFKFHFFSVFCLFLGVLNKLCLSIICWNGDFGYYDTKFLPRVMVVVAFLESCPWDLSRFIQHYKNFYKEIQILKKRIQAKKKNKFTQCTYLS